MTVPCQVVLGLDVSKDRIGWGVAALEGGAGLACGCEHIEPTFRGEQAPSQIRTAMRNIGQEVHKRGEVACIYIEAPYVGPNRQGSLEHALTIGSVWQAASRMWPHAPTAFIQPQAWKKRVGVPHSRLKGAALAQAAVEWALDSGLVEMEQLNLIREAAKPMVYARALEVGYRPAGSQDAADAGLIATAGALVNAEIVAAHVAARGAAA